VCVCGVDLIPYFLPNKVAVVYFAQDFKHHFEMDNSESGDDLGNNFLTVETQSYMVQGEDLDGKVMLIRNEVPCRVNKYCIRIYI
jgi:hypothetical protein